MLRTHTCGDLSAKDAGKHVTLAGWVNAIRIHGNVTFLDVKDRYGITQVVCKDLAEVPKKGYVVQAVGKVAKKPVPNPKLPTGDIELQCDSIAVLSRSRPLPLDLEDTANLTEETRLRYRYLDLRRDSMQHNLQMRHRIVLSARNYFDSEGFIEVETPVLAKSTPEGARDYLVPSRIQRGKFYALPQSPQIFKQLCMIGGLDRYFQVTKCYRDEDLRADRQPEFTQVDVEASFVAQEDVFGIIERLLKRIFKESLNVDLKIPFPRMAYDEAMGRFGLDKPDIRFGMELQDITGWAQKSGIDFLKEAKLVKAIVAPELFEKKKIEQFADLVKAHGAKGLAYVAYGKEVAGSIVKALGEDQLSGLKALLKIKDYAAAKDHATVFIIAGPPEVVNPALGTLRNELGKPLDKDEFTWLWVTDFPMFEYSGEEKRWMAKHHPFTQMKPEHRKYLKTGDLDRIYSSAYDVVLNGVEIGSGSIRVHDPEEQKEVFEALKLTSDQIEQRFGFLINALSYGAPPMGGIALGLDRLAAIMTGNESMRDVIAFPKNKDGVDLMLGSPGTVDREQLDELGIRVK